MARIDMTTAGNSGTQMYAGAGTNYVFETPAGVLYKVYVNSSADVQFKKSTDGGITWGPGVMISGAITCQNLSAFYDRHANIAAGLIHVAYTDSVAADTLYRTINTESSDALSTETTIFNGTSAATGGHLSIARAVGGNVYCKTVIDAGAEGGFYRLPNANVPNGAWDAARTADEAIATQDQMILLPDYNAADTQDMKAVFWDGSANEVSLKLYDDSANSWAETSIATSMTDTLATVCFPNFAVAMDIANTRHLLVAWSATDTLNADLRCFVLSGSNTITETAANVVLNSTDDQGLCAITLDTVTGYWHVYYGGKSDGSETFNTSIALYKKISTDSGATWGAETLVSNNGAGQTDWMMTNPRRILAPLGLFYIRTELSPNEYRYVTRTPGGSLARAMSGVN